MVRNVLFFSVLIALLCVQIAFGQIDTVTILHINDSHANLAPTGPRDANLKGLTGGIARVASLAGMLRMENPKSLFLHAGDAFIGDLFYITYFGIPDLRIFNAIGVDAMVLGNHEFDLTPYTLQTALDTAFVGGGFDILSANANLTEPTLVGLRKYIKNYTTKQVGNVKVGIFGLTTYETNEISQPSPAIIDSNYFKISAALVETLKTKQCAVILCLSHLGWDWDQILASSVSGINAIIGGHSHTLPEHALGVRSPSGDTTWIVQADAFLSTLGILKLKVSSGKVSFLDWTPYPITDAIPEEPTTAAIVNNLIAGVEATYQQPWFTKKVTYAKETFEEAPSSFDTYGNHDTPVGNLVTDAFRIITGSDIAVEVGGSTSQKLHKGPIVGADIYRTISYGFNTDNGLGYQLWKLKISGTVLWGLLEYCLLRSEYSDEFFPQVSGMKYSYDPLMPPFSRVQTVFIGENFIDASKIYTVTVNTLVTVFLERLGINYSVSQFYKDTTEFVAALMYISQQDTIEPKVEGRVVAVKTTGIADADYVPNRFELYQNYPNPFNPTTTISYSLSANSNVRLKIYDILGREVATLVDEVKPAGAYKMIWNASHNASGTYFYKLEAGGKTAVRKLMLVK